MSKGSEIPTASLSPQNLQACLGRAHICMLRDTPARPYAFDFDWRASPMDKRSTPANDCRTTLKKTMEFFQRKIHSLKKITGDTKTMSKIKIAIGRLRAPDIYGRKKCRGLSETIPVMHSVTPGSPVQHQSGNRLDIANSCCPILQVSQL